jgi:adenine-specific DNA-methyltransferase
MLDDTRSAAATVGKAVEWLGLRRREPTARRGARPKQFYPVFIDAKTGHALSIGDAITNDIVRATVPVPDGVVAIWPLLPDGTEGLWGLTPDTARAYLSQGYLRARNFKPSTGYAAVQYLPSGTVASIKCGDISVTGRDADGAVVAEYKVGKGVIPKRVWNVPSHNAETGGTAVLSKLLPGRRFPFPKSLYAVEDVLRFFVSDKPSAVILDFFGGSGTTAHAVMRLNKQDGGRRQCVLITNNEVASDEQAALRKKKFRPGDKEWEELGICEYITKPRIEAAITGISSDGSPVDGDYKFSDKYPMTLGFDENVEFFTLTYESPLRVASHREFAKIAALLWLRAGASGRRIDRLEDGWDVADTYGILANLDRSNAFIKAIKQRASVLIAYIVTDEDRLFESVSRKLGDVVQPVRLYESYLRNFEIESGRGFL